MTGTESQYQPQRESARPHRWRAWLLEGLSEQTARHPGPHGTPPTEHKGFG
ncbi:hypothetical protein [Streptomyces sp. NPDC053560]|uniref:hypothetical protein n=1 Tax=Streptomyces sp. NPDC053560 TaxID=3365711 RepID=UPI0037D56170